MIEGYKKLRELGRGATGEVLLVEEAVSKRQYAMKCGGQGSLLKWEAELLKQLQGACFPSLKEYIKSDREYLVMEYIEGMDLQALLDTGQVFSKEECVYIMEQILISLEKLHDKGMIYRDLKPANIMLDKEGRVHLIDFGAACYEDGTFVEAGDMSTTRAGTYGYAAPEQFWQGAVPDKTCDVYAAGKVLAYLLSGKNPAEPPYDVEQFCKGFRYMPEPFLEVIQRALAVEPQARYEDCACLRRGLRRAFEESEGRKLWKIAKKRTCIYKKCIWKSEYRRIF